MFVVNINGVDYTSEKDMNLMDFMRRELHITSAKNGCHEGACGACSVIVDGKVVRACVQKLSRLAGKKVISLEGFTKRELEVYAHAFALAGSVQCGFCIPGMVASAKGLIDKNPDPTRDDVRNAIKTNYCRCTGYKKIEDGILLAAKMFREDIPIESLEENVGIGRRIPRIDAIEKASGIAKYADDYYEEGMLYARNVFPKVAHAKINNIDTSEAEKMPGVVAVFTAKDIPGSRYIGHLAQDWPGMIAVGEETKFIGDTLALVVADTYEHADEAAKKVLVDFEELPVIHNPHEAKAPGAHNIHGEGFNMFGNFIIPENNLLDREVVKRGRDVEESFKLSKYVVEDTFYVPPTEHAFLEPETAIGYPDGDDGVRVVTGGQGIYDELHELSRYLGIPQEKVRIQSAYVGGGFGGKEDMSVQHQAALCAYLLKKPVKISLTRQESINYHPKRHAMEMWMKVGCDENGKLMGMQCRILSDTGAYASLGGPVLQRACTHAGGPYNYQSVDIVGEAYYTNNPPAGAFRGFGVCQSAFAVEALINRLAEMVGIDGWEIRYRNAIRPGEVLPNGQIADEGTAMEETLLAVKDAFYEAENDPTKYVGIASAMKNAGVGVGIPDPGRCNIMIKDGIVNAYSSAAEIGQGIPTVIMQIIAETLNIERSKIKVNPPDTLNSPNASTTTASRQTVFTGQATRLACEQLKADLDSGKTFEELEGKLYKGEFDISTDPITSTKENPVSHIAYGYATQLTILSEDGKVEKVVSANDLGKVINPIGVEGQLEGGIAMGLGYGLTEDFPTVDGVPKVKFGTLGLFKSVQMPEIELHLIEKNKREVAAYGAKGVGEIACIPEAPALQNAYYKKDGNFRTRLPLEETPYHKKKHENPCW